MKRGFGKNFQAAEPASIPAIKPRQTPTRRFCRNARNNAAGSGNPAWLVFACEVPTASAVERGFSS